MPLIPAEPLLGGVSRQPDPVRLPSQVQESINMLPDVSLGLTKRASQDLIKEISSGITENTFTQYFEDSDGTPYFMRIDDMTGGGTDPVRIWNLERADETLVKTPTSKTTTDAYFDVASPVLAKDAFRTATSADTTIITNNTQAINNGAILPNLGTSIMSAFFVKVEQADSKYKVTVEWSSTAHPAGTSQQVTYTSPGSGSSNRGPNNIAVGIEALFAAGALGADAEVTLDVVEGVMQVVLIVPNILHTLHCRVDVDPVGNDKGIVAINREVVEFTDLPNVWGHTDYPIKVTGSDENDFIEYYVAFTAEDPGGLYFRDLAKGVWTETVLSTHNSPAIVVSGGTFPVRLILDRSDFTAARGFAFLLEQFESSGTIWASRAYGDVDSAPSALPDGSKIADVFFYKNRLGFLADETLALSELNEPFNLYPTTVLDVLDTDPIAVQADSAAVNVLKRAISSDNSLLVFSKDAQFELSSAPTPETATLNHLSGYESDTDVLPVTTARSILFSSPETDVSSRVMEFQRLDADIFTANDVTLHIPRYITGRIAGMVAHTASRTSLFWTGETDTGLLYVNNTLHQGAEKVQNAWHKWSLNSSGLDLNHIMGAHFFDDKIYVTIRNTSDDSVIITKIDNSPALHEPMLNYRYLLDYRQEDADLTITPSGPNYEFDYDYCSPTAFPQVVRHDPITGETEEIDVISVVGTTVTTAEASNFSVGMVPEYSWKPSKPVLKDENGKAILHVINNLQLQSVFLYHDRTHRYESTLTSFGRDSSTDSMIATEGNTSLYNVVAIETDAYETKIGAIYRDLDLEFTSNNIYPATFVNIEWHVEAGSHKG